MLGLTMARPIKRVLDEGVVLPIESVDVHPIIRFQNWTPQRHSNFPQEELTMHLDSFCHRSGYYTAIHAEGNYPFRPVRLGITPLNDQLIRFEGVLSPVDPMTDEIAMNAMGLFCILSPSIPGDAFGNLLGRYRNKLLSLWFQNEDFQAGPAGEFGVGTINEQRIAEGPRTRFRLRSLAYNAVSMANSWVTPDTVEVRVGALVDEPCKIVFALENAAIFVPKNIYEMVIRGLQGAKKTALDESLPFIPAPLVQEIDGFQKTSRMRRFDCQNAILIPDMNIGELFIAKEMLYERVGNKCQLLIKPTIGQATHLRQVYLGLKILRKFHVTVDFNVEGGEYVEFAPRATSLATGYSSGASSSASSSRGGGASSSRDVISNQL